MTYTATTLNTRRGAENHVLATFKLDVTSYETDGEDISDTLDLSFPNAVVAMTDCVSNESGKTGQPVFDLANKKLMFYNLGDASQVTAEDDQGEWVATFMGW